MDLLLLSNSTNHGQQPWEHARDAARLLVEGRTVLFIAYALADHDAYTAAIQEAFRPMGAEVVGLHTFEDPHQAIDQAEAVYAGGGNTFRLVHALQRLALIETLQDRVRSGMPYLGASAGTNLACPTIKTTNDMPIVEPSSFAALGLIPFQINTHYLDPDPSSTHMGETREARIREYHEENNTPVLGLREGGWLRISDGEMHLAGNTARLFPQGEEPVECQQGPLIV